MKKIYIVADMEGASGVVQGDQCVPDSPGWREARNFMAGDVNAAIAGAFEGGAEEVLVGDFHWWGVANLPMERMNPQAIYEQHYDHQLMPGLTDDFTGLFMVGMHAMAGAAGAFMDHTSRQDNWFRYTLAGRECGEIGICDAYAGHFGVPLLLVTGDAAACREAEEFAPGAEVVAVKEAVSRRRARSLHPEKAAGRIHKAAARAVGRAEEVSPCLIDLPNEVELEYTRTDLADEAAQNFGAERTGPRTVRRELGSTLDIVKGF